MSLFGWVGVSSRSPLILFDELWYCGVLRHLGCLGLRLSCFGAYFRSAVCLAQISQMPHCAV